MKLFLKLFLLFTLIVLVFSKNSNDMTNSKFYENFIKDQLKISNKQKVEALDKAIAGAQDTFSPSIFDKFGAFSGLLGLIPYVGTGFSTIFDMGLSYGNAKLMKDLVKQLILDINNLIEEQINDKFFEYTTKNFESIQEIIQELEKTIISYENSEWQNITDSNAIISKIDSIHTAFVRTKFLFDEKNNFVQLPMYTLFAHSHIHFLNSVYKNKERYRINSAIFHFLEPNYFFEMKSQYYKEISDSLFRSYEELRYNIDSNKVEGKTELNHYIIFANWADSYVLKLINTWWAVDPYSLPKGVILENAKITLSEIIGDVGENNDRYFKPWDIHQIATLLDGKNMYAYEGKLLEVTTRENSFFMQIYLAKLWLPFMKYVSSSNYLIRQREKVEQYGLGLAYDDGNNGGAEHPIQTSPVVRPIGKINGVYYSFLKDFPFVYGFSLLKDGNNIYSYGKDYDKEGTAKTISFEGKTLNKLIPTNYLYNSSPNGLGKGFAMVNGVIMCFVDEDIIDANIIIQGGATQVDSQKYYHSTNKMYYSNEYFNPSKMLFTGIGSLQFESQSKLSYQLTFTSYDRKPRAFKIFLRGNPMVVGNLELHTYQATGSVQSCVEYVGNFKASGLYRQTEGYLWEIATVTLESTDQNFIMIENIGISIAFNSLIVKDLDY
ncbi:hypothetical protein DICPUDRAFT_80917 [Dictyostelium purpureum]|uniref:Pesticidal crystal protein N-terminal domain-containing protein n=1 Tax=Dictyostelium purpureum TaxID=5786 RepID=F0ZRX4_DICPU|nr:uncharacterized protein DICPUDRAFT_80917 [Dictyostelium purpureum]EGC33305.1 hypothetical protein DICPUDRAFT_80917 [Dictyostelium purpureum]|eukprot:XP_003290161.1 hypothetical protein DICPUDRAFT_80917 [Dictyostelium purpureum]